MTTRITYVNYKDDVTMSIMKNGEDKTPNIKAAVESCGGKLLGYYGLIGQDQEVRIIADCESQTDYMSLVISAYLGGAVSEIKTLTCWTGEELVVYSKKAQSVSYLSPKTVSIDPSTQGRNYERPKCTV